MELMKWGKPNIIYYLWCVEEESQKKIQIENYERDLTHQHYINTWSIVHDGGMKEAMN